MPIWVVLAAVASIVISALLSWILWRINLPFLREARAAQQQAAPPTAEDEDD